MVHRGRPLGGQPGHCLRLQQRSLRPDDSVTREQLATILFRYAQSKGAAGHTGGPSERLCRQRPDQWLGPSRHELGGESGLISGTGTGLNPQGSASRAELAMILMRFLENVLK